MWLIFALLSSVTAALVAIFAKLGQGGGVNFSSSDFGIGTDSEEWRNSGLGDAQEKACQQFVAALVAKKDRLE